MGEMAEIFNGFKQRRKQQREARGQRNAAVMQDVGIQAYEQSKNVYRIDTEDGAVMYYVSSNSWQHKGKAYRGQPTDLKNWLTKRGLA